MRSKISDFDFIEAVKKSSSIRQLLISIGLKAAGGNYKHAKLRIERLKLDIVHFGTIKQRQGWSKGIKFPGRNKIPLAEILVDNSHYLNTNKLRKRLLNEGVFKSQCNKCNLTEWLGKPIPLELEHKNGDNRDHRIENLELLCPNCHALTPNYRGRNKKIRRGSGGIGIHIGLKHQCP